MLDVNQTYHRKECLFYDENGNQIIKFIGYTNDANVLTGKLVENMNNYIRCYPERVEIIKENNVQLNLF